MSGLDELFSQSNERWSEAARRSQGVTDRGLGEAVRRYYAVYFPAGLVALVALLSVAALLIFGPTLVWSTVLELALAFAGVAALIGGLIYNAKKIRPAADLGRIDVLVSLTGDEQKQIRRQFLGKAPVKADHATVARAAAVQHRKNVATQLILLPMLPLVFIAQAVPGSSDIWWLMALGVAVYIVGAVMLAREFRQAGRFLHSTAGPPRDH